MKALTIPEAAKLAGMSRWGFARYAKRIHAESGGQFLAGTPKKYLVTYSALKKWMPELFDDTRTIETQVAELKERLETTEWKLEELMTSYKKFRKQAFEWFNRGANGGAVGR
jgi:hypothetical protein